MAYKIVAVPVAAAVMISEQALSWFCFFSSSVVAEEVKKNHMNACHKINLLCARQKYVYHSFDWNGQLIW